MAGADQGQRDGLGGRGGVLQGQQRHRERGQRGERPSQHQVAVIYIIYMLIYFEGCLLKPHSETYWGQRIFTRF